MNIPTPAESLVISAFPPTQWYTDGKPTTKYNLKITQEPELGELHLYHAMMDQSLRVAEEPDSNNYSNEPLYACRHELHYIGNDNELRVIVRVFLKDKPGGVTVLCKYYLTCPPSHEECYANARAAWNTLPVREYKGGRQSQVEWLSMEAQSIFKDYAGTPTACGTPYLLATRPYARLEWSLLCVTEVTPDAFTFVRVPETEE